MISFPFMFCANSLSFTVNPAERGSGGLQGENPNGLSASATLAKGDVECQHYLLQWRLRRPQTPSAFSTAASFCEAITKPNLPRTRVSRFAVPQMQSAFHRRVR